MNEQDSFYQTFPDYTSAGSSEMHPATMNYNGESINYLQYQIQWPASLAMQSDLNFGRTSAISSDDWPTDQRTIWTPGSVHHAQQDAHTETLHQGWSTEEVPARPPQPRYNHPGAHPDWEVEPRPAAYAPPQSRQSYGSNNSRQLLGAGQNDASHGSFFPSSSANSAIFYSEANGTSFPIPSYTVIVDDRSINTIDTLMDYCPYSKVSNIMGDPWSDGNAQSEAFTSASSGWKYQSALSGFVQFPWGQSHEPSTSTKSKFNACGGEQSTSKLIMVCYAN